MSVPLSALYFLHLQHVSNYQVMIPFREVSLSMLKCLLQLSTLRQENNVLTVAQFLKTKIDSGSVEIGYDNIFASYYNIYFVKCVR